MRDWNYRTPLVDLTSEHELPEASPGGVVEQGAHFKTPAEGKVLARVRAEERQAEQHYYTGRSDLTALAAGARARSSATPSSTPSSCSWWRSITTPGSQCSG